MAIGKLGTGVVQRSYTGTPTTIYIVPAGKYATVNIIVSNIENDTSGDGVRVLIYIGGEILMKPVLDSNTSVEIKGVVCSSGEKVMILVEEGGAVHVRVHGFEQSIPV